MRIPASWVIAGALAIGLTSCGGEEASTGSSPSASPSASSSSASPSPSASPTAQSFSQPLVSGKDKGDGKTGGKDGKDKKVASKPLNAISGLTRSTDPTEQAKKVQAQINARKANRSDPFTSLPPIVTFTAPQVPSSLPQKPSSPISGGGSSGGRSGSGSPILPGQAKGEEAKPANMPELPKFPEIFRSSPRPVARPVARPLNPGRPGGSGNPSNKPIVIPVAPPIPQPTLAREVEVTGIVTIGNRTQAIVKAPNEPTSRYVSVGDRISGGQVLVKRIEQAPGLDPVVILEENGIEVPVSVGAKKSTNKP